MDMIEAIIVEDEIRAASTLQNVLKLYCAQVKVLTVCQSVEEAINAIEALSPRLVFIDVKIAGGTGFDVLSAFSAATFRIIFITAHDEFAVKAFKYSALDYLLKPVDPDELVEAVSRIEMLDHNIEERLRVLEDHLNMRGTPKLEKLIIPTSDGIDIIKLEEIIYCKADRNYTRVILGDGKMIVSSKTLKHYENLLSDSGFFRSHISYLINVQLIRKFHKSDGILVMTNGDEVDVTTNRKGDLIERISQMAKK